MPTTLLTSSPSKAILTRNQFRGFWAAWAGWALDGMDSFIYALVLVPSLTELLPRSGIPVTPGNYQFTIVAIPPVNQQYGLYGIQIANSAPTVTLTASPTSVAIGGLTTLSWTTTSATACTASGGAFSGNQATAGSTSVVVSATTTYTLTCTGPGGSGSQTAAVTATAAAAKSGGGGGMGLGFAGFLGALSLLRLRMVGGDRTWARHRATAR